MLLPLLEQSQLRSDSRRTLCASSIFDGLQTLAAPPRRAVPKSAPLHHTHSSAVTRARSNRVGSYSANTSNPSTTSSSNTSDRPESSSRTRYNTFRIPAQPLADPAQNGGWGSAAAQQPAAGGTSFSSHQLGGGAAVSSASHTASTSYSGSARSSAAVVTADGRASPLEALRRERELLVRTIAETRGSIQELEAGLRKAGVTVPPAEGLAVFPLPPMTAADLWSPAVDVAPGGSFTECYGSISSIPGHDGTDCFKWDGSLASAAEHYRYRWGRFKNIRRLIDENEGGLDNFTQGYRVMGFNRGQHQGQAGLWYREWAPAAKALALIGDFNDWSPGNHHWAVKNTYGVWELFLPDAADGRPTVPHRSKVKCRLQTSTDQWMDRIPAWTRWATQEWNQVHFNGVYWDPPSAGAPGEVSPDKSYTFMYPRPERPRSLRIYECHIGMSSAEPKINSYLEFKRDMLPRIRNLGYNTIQIMAVQEHAYYGSFGYHVTNFFAASSRFGTPEELKSLIDEAHHLGLTVLMDIVHSHASSNSLDGISMFDGSGSHYFHEGERGHHWMWDSRLFNYGNWETLRFLLSNARYWIDEFKFDGYRFDGVTSIMYHHHGLNYTFTGGSYDEYFGMSTDVDAVVYLMLMNQVLHDLFPSVITIGEDVSGMPSFCRPWHEGGVGFDHRLQMAIADKWIQVLRNRSDDSWDMTDLVHTMTNRRHAEKCVGYAESHDQALVGDKTIAFWLMDKEMYNHMGVPGHGPASAVIDRGMALHKMIRLLTFCLGGEGYLNFMGNEFGHPEWIDFPRVDSKDPSTGAIIRGNGGSLDKCRRRWDLADAPFLRYSHLNAFDRAMCHLDKAFGLAGAPHIHVSRQDNHDKVIVAEVGDLVLVFNFHPVNSYTDYRIGTDKLGPYKVVLSSDEAVFGGWRNVSKDADVVFHTSPTIHDKRRRSFLVYAPSRTVVAYGPAEWADPSADGSSLGVPGLGVRGLGPYYAR